MQRNRTRVILVVLGCVIIAIGVFIFELNKKEQENMQKLKRNIPENAVWKGDIDEGFWIEIVEIDQQNQYYHFKIYNDYDGELEIDALFRKDGECELPLDSTIMDMIGYVEFNIIHIKDRDCILKIEE